jgi:hypothetical protein
MKLHNMRHIHSLNSHPEFMELEGSLPHLQAPTTRPNPQPDHSGSCPNFLKIQFNSILLYATYHVSFPLLASYQNISPSNRPCEMFYNIISGHREELLVPHPIPKLEDHPLSAVRNCLFNLDVCTMHFPYFIIFVQQMHTVCQQLGGPW